MSKKRMLTALIALGVPLYAHAGAKWRQEIKNIKPVSLKSYEAEYPIFAEADSLTTFEQFNPNKPGCQIQSIHDLSKFSRSEQNKCMDTGGGGGHGILFLRGACRVPNAPYPQIYNCSNDPAVMADPNSGVGISTNEIFFNVAWVAIPGRQLFYYGDVKPDEDLSMARYQSVIQTILNGDYYRGIVMNPRFLHLAERPANSTDKEWLVDQSIGTDFGSGLGRNVLYVRVPLSSRELDRMIGYLNFLNHKIYSRYQTQKGSFWWDIALNNCSHTVNNAFAAAGLVREKDPINVGANNMNPKPNLLRLGFDIADQITDGNIAIPTNVVIDVATYTSQLPFKSLIESYNSDYLRWLVAQGDQMIGPGTLVGANFMHAENKNEAFLEGPDPFIMGLPDFLPIPFFNPARRRDRLYTSAQTTQIAANRTYFEQKIAALLQNAQAELQLATKYYNHGEDVNMGTLSYHDRLLYETTENAQKFERFKTFAEKYQAYLNQELSRLERFN